MVAIIICLVLFICLGISGVISVGVKNKNKSTEITDNKKDDNNVSANDDRYAYIIEEYRSAMNDVDFNNVNIDNKYPNINSTVMHLYHNYNTDTMTLNYVYYDINKDGNDELIVFSNSSSKNNNLAEIYTYDGNKANKFINDICLGEKCIAKIYDNGIIYYYGAGGALFHELVFYKIGNDGYSKKVVKNYSVEYSDNNVAVTDSATKTKTDYTTDEDVILNVVGNAKEIDLSILEWKEIK